VAGAGLTEAEYARAGRALTRMHPVLPGVLLPLTHRLTGIGWKSCPERDVRVPPAMRRPTVEDRAMDEARALLAVLTHRDPQEPTACRGWRVRDVVTHLAAGAREASELIEAALRGQPGRPTRPFAEREAAYQATPYAELLAALAGESARLDTAMTALTGVGGTVEFTGARLTGDDMRTHSRSELAVHRWDIVGDDDIGRQLLAQPDLTAHAVKVLTTMTTLQESAAARAQRLAEVPDDFAFGLRSAGSDDVLVRIDPQAALEMRHPDAGTPVVHSSAADRLLMLWGRRPPADRIDMSDLPAGTARLVETFLYV